MPKSPAWWVMKVVVVAPCGAAYEFTGDKAGIPASHHELSVRFRDFIKAIGFDPTGWRLEIYSRIVPSNYPEEKVSNIQL